MNHSRLNGFQLMFERPLFMTDLEFASRQPSKNPGFTAVAGGARLAFVDNLRWVMIVFVVSMHAAVTYSHLGSWYFMEDPKPGQAMTAVFATYPVFLQAFFMGFLFLIAGYFVPGAFDRKGLARFLRDRAIRLGIPTLLFMLTIQPVTVYWLLRVFADPDRTPLARAYWPYLSSGRFLSGSGPMWFTFALLGFSLVYGLVRRLRRTPPGDQPDAPLPTHRQVVGLALVMGLCGFLVRIVQPMGTSVLNMQLCFFSQYILLFVVGVRAWHRDWLLRLPYRFGMRWFTLALTWGSLGWLAFIVTVSLTHREPEVGGGLTWPSAVLSFWEAFFCLGVCLGLTVWFREKFNRRSRLTGWLSDHSFSVYFIHTPILVAITLALRPFAAPKPVKFLLATLLGASLSYLVAALILRRIPVLKRVL